MICHHCKGEGVHVGWRRMYPAGPACRVWRCLRCVLEVVSDYNGRTIRVRPTWVSVGVKGGAA